MSDLLLIPSEKGVWHLAEHQNYHLFEKKDKNAELFLPASD